MRVAAFLLLAWVGCTLPALAEKRVALVFGNAAYAQVGALANSGADAALVAQALKADDFDVTLVRDAARADMLKALKAFSDKVDEADWALVYYAGHGIEIGGVNYLLPTDAQLHDDRDAQDEAVSLNRVLEAVENARKLRIVILDACRNNPFAASMKRSVHFRAVERGLAPVEPASGTLVVYAAAAGQVADDGADGHSPFTSALVARLKEPGLEVSRLFNVVAADVLSATARRQLPFQYGSNPTREEFYFKAPAPVAAGPDAFAGFWEMLKASNDAATLHAFLDRLPADHVLRAEVEARLAQLSGANAVAALTPPPEKVIAPKPADPTECDRLAGDVFDLDRPEDFPTVDEAHFKADAAIPACRAAVEAASDDRRARYQLGRALYIAKQYESARQEFERAAAMGSVAAMPSLGLMFHNGEGVPKNFDTARLWFEKGAASGEAEAINNLGYLYGNGEGVTRNYETARRWYEKAAAAGDAAAMANLGYLYEQGLGVVKNADTARIWYEKGAAQGEPAAMNNLALMYHNGAGVTKNFTTARSWYEKSAATGNAVAMNNLGYMHENGEGFARSYSTARTWYARAAAAGNGDAQNALTRMNKARR